MRIRNRTTTLGVDQQVIQGIRKDLQSMPALYLAKEMFTPHTLEARIQQRLDAASAVPVAKAAWLQAIAACQELDVSTNAIIHDLKNLVASTFGPAGAEMADFGFTQRKTPMLTEAQKAAAVEKRAATRVARGTLGPKARLRVTGDTVKGAADGQP
jgi:hypothetical protein